MNKKLAFLVDHQEQNSQITSQEKFDCFLCKNDQDLYIKAMEKKKVIKCIVCSKLQHPICYNIQVVTDQITQLFACIPCRLLSTQPDVLQFSSIIAPMIVHAKEKNDNCEFKLQEVECIKLMNNQNYELCVYCMKMDIIESTGKYQYYSWPSDNIVIKINNALQAYQVDSLCIIDKNDLIYNENNIFSYNMGELIQRDQKQIVLGLLIFIFILNLLFDMFQTIYSSQYLYPFF